MLALTVLAATSYADTYPSKPIRIIVPAPAGGPSDYRVRQLGQKLEVLLGKPIIVENRPGAANTIGTAYVAQAKPDGYTLLFGHAGTFSYAPFLYSKLAYDPVRDFAPVALLSRTPFFLYVPSSSSIDSVHRLIEEAKGAPGTLTYGSSGPGSPQHIWMEYFKHLAGIDLLHVPYKGSAPLITDLLGGQVSTAFDAFVPGMQHVKAGRLRVLATTSSKRVASVPHVPTVAEVGVPDFALTVWTGIFAPAGTPKDVVARLNREINRALSNPELMAILLEDGSEIEPGTPDQLGAVVREELTKGEKLVKISGARLD